MPPSASPSALRTEISVLVRISAPLVAAFLAEFAMFLTTKIVVGRLGYLELAAVGLAADLTFEVLVVGMGLLSVVGVLVAQAEGAGRRADAGHAARQGLLVAVAAGIPASALIYSLGPIIALTGQAPEIVAIATPYLHAIAGCTFAVFGFAVLRLFVSALARTTVIMVITASAVGLNWILATGLVHGRFGFPALGVAGAGWATTIVSWLMLGALVFHAYTTEALRGYGLFRARLRIDRAVCVEIARLGIPVAGLVLLESGMFIAVGLLSGLLGPTSLAATQILMGWVGLPFVIALGLAEGTMVRVSHGVGSGSAAATRRAGLIGMALGIVLLGALVAVPLTVPELIIAVFLDADDPGHEGVRAVVTALLYIVALFQIFDGLQAIASRALRGLKDTMAPLWIASFGYWVLGIAGGWALAFPLDLGTEGLWWGMAAALIFTGSVLAARFVALSRVPRIAA